MLPSIIALLLSATFVSAAFSGVFGMAGGLMMTGVLVSFVPVATAMVMHGFIQRSSNFSRATLRAAHISRSIVGRYALGVGGAVLLIALLAWRPTQPMVLMLLGASAMLVWMPKWALKINVERKFQAELCDFLVQTLNMIAGVAGSLLDLFFVIALLPQQTVVATKATTQVIAHAVKIAVWGCPLLGIIMDPVTRGEAHLPPLRVFAAIIPRSLAGTWLGGKLLDRITDLSFRERTKWVVTLTGIVYLMRGMAV